MKKYLFTLIAMFMCTALSMSAEKTSKEQAFTNQVLSYLRTEGYAPSIDSDGDVKFKVQGDTYYVVVQEYDDGYYVKVEAFMNAEDANRRGVLEACNGTMASYKYVRCWLSGGSICYECAGFFSNLYQFKLMFSNYIDVLQLADKKLKSIYNEYDS